MLSSSGRCRIGQNEGVRVAPVRLKMAKSAPMMAAAPAMMMPATMPIFAVRVALADGVGAGPDFDDAPKESEHEEDSEGGAKTLLQAAGGPARGLGEDWS